MSATSDHKKTEYLVLESKSAFLQILVLGILKYMITATTELNLNVFSH